MTSDRLDWLVETRPRRPRWTTVLLFAAAAAVVVALVAKREAIVALWTPKPEHIGPDEPDPAVRAKWEAAALRKRAASDCADGYWDECEDELDRAKQKDPAGETDEAVLTMRKKVDAQRQWDGGRKDDKPKLK